MPEATETPAPAAPSPRRSTLIPALLVLNSVLVAGVLAVVVLRGNGPKAEGGGAHTGAPQAEGAAPGPTQKLADFVVHLRDPETDRYARVSFEIEVASEEDRARLAAFTPRVRDAFIAFLSDRTLEEMRGSEAIHRLKSALEGQLPALAPGVKARALYLTDLVIQ